MRSPYKGLMPYAEEDRPYFFGRDRERDLVAANLKAARLTVIYGASGVGKSSLLQAGVVHDVNGEASRSVGRRRQPEFIAVYCDNWREDPVGHIVAALGHAWTQVSLEPPGSESREGSERRESPGLPQVLASHANAVKAAVLLILDQFEEYLYYQGTRAAAESLDDGLAEILSDRTLRVHVLISLREDAVAKLDQFKGRIHFLFDNYLRIDHLDLPAARAAIVRPVETFAQLQGAGKIEVEPALVEAVVDQIRTGKLSFREGAAAQAGAGEGDRIETPYLQLVLCRVWDEECAAAAGVPACLRRETLRQLGESSSIVKNHLDMTMSAFSEEEREVAERIFFYLVTPSGTKIAHTASDLAAFAGLDESRVQGVVTKLAGHDHRILRAAPALDPSSGVTRYEIFHDALADAILDWQQRYRAGRKRRQLEDELAERERQERERLAREREIERGRRQRRTAAASLVAALLCLGLAGVAMWYGYQAQQAQRAATLNLERAKLGEALARQQGEIARQQRDRVRKTELIREAALAGNQENLNALLGTLPQDTKIHFRADAHDLEYRNPAGQEIFRFRLFPEPGSLPGGKDAVAFITYLADHPTFRNKLMTGGQKSDFAVEYTGWGCLAAITAFVEYVDPEHQPTVSTFDGCQGS
jgi:hypothetical protein